MLGGRYAYRLVLLRLWLSQLVRQFQLTRGLNYRFLSF